MPKLVQESFAHRCVVVDMGGVAWNRCSRLFDRQAFSYGGRLPTYACNTKEGVIARNIIIQETTLLELNSWICGYVLGCCHSPKLIEWLEVF